MVAWSQVEAGLLKMRGLARCLTLISGPWSGAYSSQVKKKTPPLKGRVTVVPPSFRPQKLSDDT